MVLSQSVQDFNDKVAASPELQAQLREITSPMAFLALAKAEGFEMSPQDFGAIAQSAYQQWVGVLDNKLSGFFRQVHETKALDERLKTCPSTAAVIALAQDCGVDLSETELRHAAEVAEAVPGFSFEKLWFRGLGVMG